MNALELLAQFQALKAAWTTYTPTVSAVSGAITAYTASGRYLLVGKTLYLELQITITTNGTGAGLVLASLPTSLGAASLQVLAGREVQNTGNALTGTLAAAGTNVQIATYNNGYPGANGNVLVLSGVIEVA